MKKVSFSKIPLLIYGSGGISTEVSTLIETINSHNHNSIYRIMGYIEKDTKCINKKIGNHIVVASDDTLESFLKKFNLIGLIIPIGDPNIKKKIIRKISRYKNVYFPNLIHPSASLDGEIKMGFGNIITAGCRFTNHITISDFNLFNLNVTIGHEVIIGNYCVINPGATISGGVILNDAVLVGTGANLLQYVHVEKNAIIGAGALLTQNVSAGQTVVGIPAKPLKISSNP